MIIVKPITTEKTIRIIELENKIVFEVDRRANKEEIKKEIEKTFKVKTDSINTIIKKNKKIAYVKISKGYDALDIANKLGIM
jgi:large subunit ribosomal protein L23